MTEVILQKYQAILTPEFAPDRTVIALIRDLGYRSLWEASRSTRRYMSGQSMAR